MTSGTRTLMAAAGAAAATTAYVLACGPFLVEYRAMDTIAPAHRETYARGSVGIVRPRFARRYLVQAYRRFSGMDPLPGLVPQDAVVDDAKQPPPTPAERWTAIRGSVLNTAAAVNTAAAAPVASTQIDVNRYVGQSYQSIQNCLDDAFTSAIATAEARLKTSVGGASSPQMREWMRAQDAVFTNCKGGPLVLPEPAPAGADALTRADRAYQTAAAYFYATRYDEAATRFRAIADDASSSWRPYGRYLAARALIRSGTVPEKPVPAALAEAEGELRRVLADPSASSLHASARGLMDFVGAHLHPAERLEAVSNVLLGSRPVPPQAIADYQWLMDRLVGDTTEYAYDEITGRDAIIKSSAMNDWVLAMQGSGAGAADRAVAQWKRAGGAPWLVAALWNVRPDHQDATALLTAAAAIDRSSPAFATLAFLRVRLLAKRGDTAAARALLATLPAAPQPGFEAETLNLLAAERLMLATSLEEALKSAPRTIVREGGDAGTAVPSADVAPVPVFDADAEVLFSQRLPLTRLVEAAKSTTLPARLRQRVAAAALVRALLLKRYPEAADAATALQPLAPSLQPELDRFRRAATPEDRHIAGLLLLLRRPGLHAHVTGPDDDQSIDRREPDKTFDHAYRRNWWCGFEPEGAERGPIESPLLALVYQDDMPSPSFLSAAERSALDREFAALAATGTAPTYLAREAVKWAVARPSDQNAAEALALAVEGTRWGCTDDTTTAASRSAFQTLHRLFPGSDWAQRTKYWY
jgi:hypothetical protein